jgi:TonB family protein
VRIRAVAGVLRLQGPRARKRHNVFEIVEKGQKPFPVERAVLLSIVAHILLLVAIVSAPPTFAPPKHPERGLLAAFIPKDSDQEKIPIIFRSAPGPARANPRRSDLSDADRRAGGGDRSKPRSSTPFIEPRPGIEGLQPGRRGRPAETAQLQGIPLPRRGEAATGESATERPAIFGPGGGKSDSNVAAGSEARSGAAGGRLSSLDQAIREAARGAAAAGGQEGGGFPNADGGFVDSGPISFDTSWYDWGPYADEMVRRIKLHWEIPELARLGWKGKLTIRFFILADGHVADAKIIRGSGIPPFDFAALQAILKSSPFRPLPSDLGSSREGVTVTFFYNLRPEKEGRPEGTK